GRGQGGPPGTHVFPSGFAWPRNLPRNGRRLPWCGCRWPYSELVSSTHRVTLPRVRNAGHLRECLGPTSLVAHRTHPAGSCLALPVPQFPRTPPTTFRLGAASLIVHRTHSAAFRLGLAGPQVHRTHATALRFGAASLIAHRTHATTFRLGTMI